MPYFMARSPSGVGVVVSITGVLVMKRYDVSPQNLAQSRKPGHMVSESNGRL